MMSGLLLLALASAEPTLAGKWVEIGRENCEGKRVAELVFTPEGKFTYSFPEDMYETKVSGAGVYRWNPASGELGMGSDPGAPYWRGKARREGNRLAIEAINIGGFQNGADMPVCRMTFSGG